MKEKTDFKETTKQHFKTLQQYIPIVDKVHGNNHPEFHTVRLIFQQMLKKVESENTADLNIKEEIQALQQITNNYTIPTDVCESFAAVYKLLNEVDKAYNL